MGLRELFGAGKIGVDGGNKRGVGQRLGALVADQSASDDGDPQSHEKPLRNERNHATAKARRSTRRRESRTLRGGWLAEFIALGAAGRIVARPSDAEKDARHHCQMPSFSASE